MNSKKVKDEFLKAVKAYLEGTADETQLLFVEQYFDLFLDSEDIFESMDSEEIQSIHDRMLWKINNEIEKKTRISSGKLETARSFSKYLYMAAAAAFVIPMSLYIYQRNQVKPVSSQLTSKITPGGNKAVLTLENGSKISLTDVKNGEVANQSGAVITKNRDSQLVYQSVSSTAKEIAYNTIETPKGGQFQLILSDGTKVWLNAASSLRYPSTFGRGNRKVELVGEAYFEVAKNAAKPFLVSSNKQVVEVLGTHFNINAYTNEPVVSTTLLEGSVKVISPFTNTYKIIKPGQQSLIHSDDINKTGIKVKNIDPDEAVAWKNGYFMFEKEGLASILRKVSRWYDVEIENPQGEKLDKLLFSGTLSKYSDVSKVLRKLELTESVHFKIVGRRIIVMQ
ncbi:ferric-dicitrate binding protein FerR (iron transport regulator) [Pedobacter cryoconitis]|uniref:Ferric-dicitrate binding protein FerR (Iron transport regulator) n=1 Tax=Pedobacter cryoconitis TaxID=188932 RepID=A0A7W9DJY5_9SPHI|nr:FecR family protein [Pedobacter cryoconitis]MBB5620635.1 ferric-dicitrate binding protein FerR (iron transport regulator) [Pedobacter cryoconitis]